jgi:hypothetical protein
MPDSSAKNTRAPSRLARAAILRYSLARHCSAINLPPIDTDPAGYRFGTLASLNSGNGRNTQLLKRLMRKLAQVIRLLAFHASIVKDEALL